MKTNRHGFNYTIKNSVYSFAFAISLLAGSSHAASPYENEWPNTDFAKTVIELSEVQSGGVPKDGIPAIDNPKFVGVEPAAQWLNPVEPVIVLERNGNARAYPLQILIWHEIVNDEFEGRHIAVTFCPLCNASIVFDRKFDGDLLDFGTTGKLRNSDLVMYDRQSESWWQQITGRSIVGAYAGKKLIQIRSKITSFAEFRKWFPHGEVLSQETGYHRPYGQNPYRGYDDINNKPFFKVDTNDDRLPPMERVLSVIHNETNRLYPFSELKKHPVINDVLAGEKLVIFTKSDTASALDQLDIAASRIIPSAAAFRAEVNGENLSFTRKQDYFYDHETNSKWNIFGQAIDGKLLGAQLEQIDSGVHFAFAWVVFYPDAEIYDPSG